MRLIDNGKAFLRRLTVLERLTVGSTVAGDSNLNVEGTTATFTGMTVALAESDLTVTGGTVAADSYVGPTGEVAAAVAEPTGGSTVDDEARGTIAEIIAVLQNLGAMVGPPFAPTNVAGTPGDEEATITFDAIRDGGDPVTDVEYRIDGGSWESGGVTESPLVITGLTNDVEIEVEVAAVNSVGRGAVSEAVTLTPTA